MHPDLHCHSHHSDGQHSPAYLIDRALNKGISHLSITDHDFVTWQEDEEWMAQDLQLIPGVEISCHWESREIHVVGLGVSPVNAGLQTLLAKQRQARKLRMQAMQTKLEQLGIEGLINYLESLPCASWTRSHVAQFLIQQGHARNWQKAFSRYLSRKGKVYVPFECCSMDDAVCAISNAGGIAILAHPGRYGLSRSKLERLVVDFIAQGGEALEGSYGNIDPTMKKHLGELASRHNLFISIGSDFHDANRHWTDLGKLPPLDSASKKNAIWHHPRWHF